MRIEIRIVVVAEAGTLAPGYTESATLLMLAWEYRQPCVSVTVTGLVRHQVML